MIATHGRLANGIKSSLDIIIGEVENVFVIEAYVEENKGIEAEIEFVMKNIGEQDELIVFTDLLGGSITNQILRFTQGKNVHVISGFNLALLIEVLMGDSNVPAAEIIESAIANAKDQMVYVTKLMNSNNAENNND